MIARTRTQYRIILNMKFNNKLVQRKKGGKNERGSWFITSDLDNSIEIIKDDDFPLRPDRRPKYFMFTMVLNTSLWIYATISRYMLSTTNINPSTYAQTFIFFNCGMVFIST